MKQLEFSSLSEKNLGNNYTIFETALNQLMPTLPSYRNLRIDLQCHANILGTLAINRMTLLNTLVLICRMKGGIRGQKNEEPGEFFKFYKRRGCF